MPAKKRRKKPTFPEGEFNEIPSDSAVSYTNEDQKSFVKEMEEPRRLITAKIPLSLYKKLRETAFKTEDKITRIIIKAAEEYIKALEK
ncbi:hypothetical protein [Wolbachia endosymbiont (group A) of Rhinocyllus conicus]|uniref:hypothetical protein n=1 Tax=Wolbachia endosymbiont (group A) of Rhinocyllus conicus TaxID=2954053 RepID=UPI0022270E5D|nr:hypothetical protein [Wolbachia endosymbiont (group A) of Rhinocyllus conicus]